MWPFGKNTTEKKNADSEIADLTEKFDSLLEVLTAEPDSDRTSTGLLDLIERVEALEMRQASLQKECVRLVQRGTQALKKAEQLREDEFQDYEMDPAPPVTVPLSNETVEANSESFESDIDYLSAQIRAQGQTPII